MVFEKKKKERHGYDAHPSAAGKVWHFLAHEDSLLSFAADAIIILVLGKFVLLPVLGMALGTSFPLVAVVSSSMDHRSDFESWWSDYGAWYEDKNITKEDFLQFPFSNGFKKGDVFVVKGLKLEDVKVGDVIVYRVAGRSDPIIHRIVEAKPNVLVTKGDGNRAQLDFEHEIRRSQLQGKAVARIPYVGWVKVLFVELVNAFK